MAVPEPDPDAVYEHTELGKCLGDVLNDLVERGALPFAARTDTMKILDDAVAKELGALSGKSAANTQNDCGLTEFNRIFVV
tara:strand:- start:4339 stop:4581 length:243 start_codon:yes stop_codon:yes gene_type:complete